MDWDDVGYIISSEYRTKVLMEIEDGVRTPKSISDNTGLPISHTSRSLKNLKDRGIIELLVPENRQKGRLYGFTNDGEDVWKEAKKNIDFEEIEA